MDHYNDEKTMVASCHTRSVRGQHFHGNEHVIDAKQGTASRLMNIFLRVCVINTQNVHERFEESSPPTPNCGQACDPVTTRYSPIATRVKVFQGCVTLKRICGKTYARRRRGPGSPAPLCTPYPFRLLNRSHFCQGFGVEGAALGVSVSDMGEMIGQSRRSRLQWETIWGVHVMSAGFTVALFECEHPSQSQGLRWFRACEDILSPVLEVANLIFMTLITSCRPSMYNGKW